MADDDVQKAGLEWVQEPAIEDGRVVYSYRNNGTATATVYETVNVAPATGSNEVQSFQLPGVAPGAEHTTHAPASPDASDGPVTVFVNVQAASRDDAWDASLDAELKAALRGGTLVRRATATRLLPRSRSTCPTCASTARSSC